MFGRLRQRSRRPLERVFVWVVLGGGNFLERKVRAIFGFQIVEFELGGKK